MFTGQTRDLGDDRFYFFKSRYYDATIGKFQSADSIVPKADNPQALNRYAYGLNNPLRLNDPTWHIYDDPSDDTSASGSLVAPPPPPPPLPTPDPTAGVPINPYHNPATAATAAANTQSSALVGTPRETWANLSIGAGTTLTSLSQQPSLQTRAVFGKVVVPDHWEAIPEGTRLAKVGRVGGALAGAAFTAVDAADVVNRYRNGSLTQRQDKGVAFTEDLLVVGALGFAGVAIGLSSAPLWLAVGAGVGLVVLGAGLRYEVEQGDLSVGGFEEGVRESFGL